MTKLLSDVLLYLMSSIKHRNKSFLKLGESLKLGFSQYKSAYKYVKLKKSRELK
jgi:hypothetical protein